MVGKLDRYQVSRIKAGFCKELFGKYKYVDESVWEPNHKLRVLPTVYKELHLVTKDQQEAYKGSIKNTIRQAIQKDRDSLKERVWKSILISK